MIVSLHPSSFIATRITLYLPSPPVAYSFDGFSSVDEFSSPKSQMYPIEFSDKFVNSHIGFKLVTVVGSNMKSATAGVHPSDSQICEAAS